MDDLVQLFEDLWSVIGRLWRLVQPAWEFIDRYEEPITIVAGILLALLILSDREHPLSRPIGIGLLVGAVIIGPLFRRFIDLPWYLDVAIVVIGLIALGAWCWDVMDSHRVALRWFVKSPKAAVAFIAFRKRQYREAADEFRRLAEGGDAAAQNNLGIMFEIGLGTTTSDTEAEHWYRKAAEQGLADAQYNLATLLAVDVGRRKIVSGEHDEESLVEGHKWVLFAAAQDHPNAKRGVKRMRKRMTPDQVSKAEKMVADWCR